jgi:hypothetical protein
MRRLHQLPLDSIRRFHQLCGHLKEGCQLAGTDAIPRVTASPYHPPVLSPSQPRLLGQPTVHYTETSLLLGTSGYNVTCSLTLRTIRYTLTTLSRFLRPYDAHSECTGDAEQRSTTGEGRGCDSKPPSTPLGPLAVRGAPRQAKWLIPEGPTLVRIHLVRTPVEHLVLPSSSDSVGRIFRTTMPLAAGSLLILQDDPAR